MENEHTHSGPNVMIFNLKGITLLNTKEKADTRDTAFSLSKVHPAVLDPFLEVVRRSMIYDGRISAPRKGSCC